MRVLNRIFILTVLLSVAFCAYYYTNTTGTGLVGGGPGTIEQLQTYKLKVSANDTTQNFLLSKLVAGSNITLTENNNGGNETITIASSAGGGGTWGSITGTLSDQTDLQTALDAKQASDTQLTSLSGLSYSSNAGKFIRVNAGETNFELATVSGSGTVTSVAMSVPTGLTVSGSPITTTGTLAVSLDTGYVIPLQSDLDGLVPYTGATGDVDLGANDLLATTIMGTGSSPLKIISYNGFGNPFTFNTGGLTAERALTVQDASGTIALLDDIPDISGLVPYTGATADLNLGTFDLLTTGDIGASGTRPANTYLGNTFISNSTSLTFATSGDKNISINQGAIAFNDAAGPAKITLLGATMASEDTDKTVTIPNATGTLALTSQLHDALTITGEDYLSLSGQQITANAIDLDNLSATGTPSSSTYLRGDNTWATISGGSPAGSDTQVQFNDGGAFGGDSGLVFNKTTDLLTIGKLLTTASGGIDVGTTGVRITSNDNGSITFLGMGSGADEAFTMDINGSSNNIDYTSSTGITDITFSNWRVNSGSAVFSGGANPLTVTNTQNTASAQAAIFGASRTFEANDDEAYMSFRLKDSDDNATEYGRLTWVATDITDTSEDGRLDFSTRSAGTLAKELSLDATNLFPTTSDGLSLGNGSNMFSDVFLASGGVINFNNGNATLTHSSGLLTSNVDIVVPDEAYDATAWNGSLEIPTKNAIRDKIETLGGSGASTALDNLASVAINTSLISDTDNTDALGSAAISWSDLFLGNGSVITFSTAPSTSDVTITHSSNALTFAGGTIALGTATATGGLTGNVTGDLTGNASTATALASNPSDCGANQFAISIVASGNLTCASITNADVPDILNLTGIPNLTSNGFVKTSGGDGTLSIDTNTYLTANQTITLSGDVTGSGTTGITTTIGNDKILESMLKAVDTATDEECLTYESTTGDFEWQTCGGGTITGSDTQVTFFDGANNPAGDAGLTYNKTTDALTVSGALASTTLDTGQGANELYDMDQNVLTTSSPQFTKLGIGATADASRILYVTGNVSGGVATIERTNATTNQVVGTVIIKGTSTGDMTDGFGSAFQFAVQDTAAVENLIADIRGIRSGADAGGQLQFSTSTTAGSMVSALLINNTQIVGITTGITPTANDGAALGASGTAFSDLFLASGSVINFNAGDVTITHGANLLTIAGGDVTLTGAVLSTDTLTLTGTGTLNGLDAVDGTTETTIESIIDTLSNLTSVGTISTGVWNGTAVGLAYGGTGATTAAEAYNNIADMDGTPNTDHTANGPHSSTFNSGATVTVMETVYMGSGGKWLLTDADAEATSAGMIGIALESKNDTQAMNVAMPGSYVRDDTWNWTVGGTIYLSTTPGALTQTQPSGTDDVIRVVGYAVSADVIYFIPSPDYITHT